MFFLKMGMCASPHFKSILGFLTDQGISETIHAIKGTAVDLAGLLIFLVLLYRVVKRELGW